MDRKYHLEPYLQQFERFATTAKWGKGGWATKLSVLLSGRALDVNPRMSEEAASDYGNEDSPYEDQYQYLGNCAPTPPLIQQ